MRATLFRSSFLALAIASGTTATAEDYVLDVGSQVKLDGVGGGWGRAFAAGDGDWYYLFGGAGDYRLMDLSSDFQYDFSSAVTLTGRTNLIDHAITRCPDGTYLHLASGATSTSDDSAWGFRYDENWSLIAEADVDVNNPDYQHNDLPILCSDALDMAVFQPRIDAEAPVFLFDSDLNQLEHNLTMSPVPPIPGSSLHYDLDTDTVLRFTAPEIETEDPTPRNKLIVFRFYWDQEEPYEVKTEIDMTAAGIPDNWQAYWPQGLLRIGDFYFLAHMARPTDEGYNQDDGNVFLEVFDLNFNRLETHQLTDDPGPEANQRPSLALQDDILLVTYDKRINNQLINYVLPIQINLEAISAGSPNLSPTAYAGADFNGAVGALATLDGTGSSDPDGDELTYEWSIVSAPTDSALTDEDLVNRFTAEPSFVPDVTGEFQVELSISDGEDSDVDSVIVTVIENLPPTASAGEDQKVALTESVLLDGTASSDPDGDELSYSWYFDSMPEDSTLSDSDISAANSSIAAFLPDVEGSYVVTLEITDGNFVETDQVEITVGSGGCGCATAPTSKGNLAWVGFMVGMLLFRRRQQR